MGNRGAALVAFGNSLPDAGKPVTRAPMVSSGPGRPPLRAKATPKNSCPRQKRTSRGATGSIRSPGGYRWESTRRGGSRSGT
jgi:hypothetical protein